MALRIFRHCQRLVPRQVRFGTLILLGLLSSTNGKAFNLHLDPCLRRQAALVDPNVIHVAEGLFTRRNMLPVALEPSWSSTIAIIDPKRNKAGVLGTAFPLAVLPRIPSDPAGSQRILFMTAKHVLDSNACNPRDSKCFGIKIARDLRYDYVSGKYESLDELYFPEGIENIQRSKDYDLVTFELVLPSVKKKPQLRVQKARFSPKCYQPTGIEPGDKVYSIGFPATPFRTNVNRLEIEEQSIVQKRWSTGVASQYLGYDAETLLSGTQDGLPGSSGGWILDADGRIVGITKAIKGTYRNSYVGSEDAGRIEPHAFGIPCQDAVRFLRQVYSPDVYKD